MLFQQVGHLIALLCGQMMLVSLFSVSSVKASIAERKIEEISGVVVAYDNVKPSVTCVEVCQSSLLVRLGMANQAESHYIRVDLTFPSYEKFPKEIIKSKGQWKFKLIRMPALDERLTEFIHGEDAFGKEFKYPIWRFVPGAENEKLPFGEVVPTYSLVKNGFKIGSL